LIGVGFVANIGLAVAGLVGMIAKVGIAATSVGALGKVAFCLVWLVGVLVMLSVINT
jgi:hypothetical protein